VPALKTLVEQDTAGSPVDEGQRWTNRSAADLTDELQDQGFEIGVDAVRRLLVDELRLSQRQAFKDDTSCSCVDRDAQFLNIARQRTQFERRGWPVLSIDTKKKEILGNFWHPGQAWTDGQVRVEDHDFVTAEDRLVPYGVYDTVRNEALMYLARGADTCDLVCDALRAWRRKLGEPHYKYAPRVLLLCDCGGSNGYRQHRFKEQLCRLATEWLCDIQVAHYPPGCSKYNPIEHRLFCHVTHALKAVILKTMQVAKYFIGRTSTTTGLSVVVECARRMYEKGLQASANYFQHQPIRLARQLPQFNYTAPFWNLLS
jgi:hypothetical protein